MRSVRELGENCVLCIVLVVLGSRVLVEAGRSRLDGVQKLGFSGLPGLEDGEADGADAGVGGGDGAGRKWAPPETIQPTQGVCHKRGAICTHME